MKKLMMMGIAISLTSLSVTAFACPKGSSLQGGTGPHHKGSKCVASSSTSAKKTSKVEHKK